MAGKESFSFGMKNEQKERERHIKRELFTENTL